LLVSIYQLKSSFQNLLRPIVRRLAKIGITANQVTIAAILLSGCTGAAIAIWPQQRQLLLLIPFVFFLRMALNAIDGMLAREHQMKTPLGGILNELGDVFSDIFLYLPFGMLAEVNPRLLIALTILAIVSEMTGVLGPNIGASRRYDGPMGKSDRAFLFSIIAILLAWQLIPTIWLNYLWGGAILLSIQTIFNRIRGALKEVATNGMESASK
jgi:CDP-diacylglycerol---glycerol-3-phosphate 3-phosphatidyltransferase